jgi:hypothetical protein
MLCTKYDPGSNAHANSADTGSSPCASACSCHAMVHRIRIDPHAFERRDSATMGDTVLKAMCPCRANMSRKPDQLCSASRHQVLAEQHRSNTRVPRLAYFRPPSVDLLAQLNVAHQRHNRTGLNGA